MAASNEGADTVGASTDATTAGEHPGTVSGPPFDVRPLLSGLAAPLAGPANVIMQLSRPAVGHGVAESRVESGRATDHPVRRARTTFTYLAVALLGTDEDRKAYREAVNRQHALVRSTGSSPVAYSAFDTDLQLWVAACLYRGMVDLTERLHGPLDPLTADRLYAHCARFGTTLQVPPDMWPPDRPAFDRYWELSVAQASIDDTVRRYLVDLTELEHLPWPVRRLLARPILFWTRGFLPPPFRELMGYRWAAADESRFSRRLRRIGRIEGLLPSVLRTLPWTLLLRDMRRRRRRGQPLV